MIDLATETLLSLPEAAHALPAGRRKRPVSVSCIFRWIASGVKLSSGEVVRLEAIRLGGRWLTSKEALQRFAEAQTPQLDDSAPAGQVAAKPEKAARRSERAAVELEKLGI
jgi:hypothetical protein